MTPPPADAALAAVDALPPDAGLSAALAAATPYVFRYSTAQRSETWTLRHSGSEAAIVVENAQGTQQYVGTATAGDGLAVAVSTGTAKLALACKRESLAVSATCNDPKAKAREVLNCYHPDFKAPMPFGPAPGIEYVVNATCNGYRLVAP